MLTDKRRKTALFAVGSLVIVLVIATVTFKVLKKASGKNSCLDFSSYYYSKYDMINHMVILKTAKLENRPYLYIPEVEGNKHFGGEVSPSGNQFYDLEDYTVTVVKIDEGLISLNMNPERRQIKEVNNIKYYLYYNFAYFAINDTFFEIRQKGVVDIELDKVLNDVKLYKYEVIDKDTVRCTLHDEKTTNYVFNEKELELSRIYKEINYKIGLEYDVYTDGLNEYMFDSNNELIGYRINNTQSDYITIAQEEISKYINLEKYALEEIKKEDNANIFEYIHSINDLKTDGFAKIKVDNNGNIIEMLYNETKVADAKAPNVNVNLIEKQIKYRMESIFIVINYIQFKNIESFYYTYDEIGNLVIVCTVNIRIRDIESSISLAGVDEYLSLIITVKGEDCILQTNK